MDTATPEEVPATRKPFDPYYEDHPPLTELWPRKLFYAGLPRTEVSPLTQEIVGRSALGRRLLEELAAGSPQRGVNPPVVKGPGRERLAPEPVSPEDYKAILQKRLRETGGAAWRHLTPSEQAMIYQSTAPQPGASPSDAERLQKAQDLGWGGPTREESQYAGYDVRDRPRARELIAQAAAANRRALEEGGPTMALKGQWASESQTQGWPDARIGINEKRAKYAQELAQRKVKLQERIAEREAARQWRGGNPLPLLAALRSYGGAGDEELADRLIYGAEGARARAQDRAYLARTRIAAEPGMMSAKTHAEFLESKKLEARIAALQAQGYTPLEIRRQLQGQTPATTGQGGAPSLSEASAELQAAGETNKPVFEVLGVGASPTAYDLAAGIRKFGLAGGSFAESDIAELKRYIDHYEATHPGEIAELSGPLAEIVSMLRRGKTSAAEFGERVRDWAREETARTAQQQLDWFTY